MGLTVYMVKGSIAPDMNPQQMESKGRERFKTLVYRHSFSNPNDAMVMDHATFEDELNDSNPSFNLDEWLFLLEVE